MSRSDQLSATSALRAGRARTVLAPMPTLGCRVRTLRRQQQVYPKLWAKHVTTAHQVCTRPGSRHQTSDSAACGLRRWPRGPAAAGPKRKLAHETPCLLAQQLPDTAPASAQPPCCAVWIAQGAALAQQASASSQEAPCSRASGEWAC
jgi:hypothetical protein